ncbi:Cyclohexanone 1,2-monooxygenase [Pelagimonas phthalicica]|uniref:Trimethylamine monooxygenase n=1 Tax=Pelagimonas phthalicica TaxID=1037362 RepID=A0A238JIG9_9RHOB|nr:NAD(P)/FAD-dependent oxidoreductase [Pelagimonas phthalicica]TDS88395.1 cation diffusion facilitator CzcD-associated flavoprotein CzcO [Pelagimonas phthalicica]SMX30481.1 Cyclohexanone 1,2-monooxygenase [Pelagimonas phthalicica]
MVKRKTVAVIGGGVSGLAAAKAFDERGHRVLGFERSHDFGGVWELSRSYPDVQTQSPKDLYCFTDHPMPEEYPEWPKGPQVHAYLHSYAAKHNLARLFKLNTTIKGMDRRTDGGWTLTIDEAGQEYTQDVDFVAVCTGQFSDKNIISHPGQEGFVQAGGEVMHSSEYTDPSMIKGKRVVVLGGSKSATDIAVNAANSGARSVHWVYLEPVWRIPYFVGGINFKRLLYMRAQEQQFNAWGKSPLQRVVAAVLKPLVWANFRGLEALLKTQLGLKKYGMVPKIPIEKDVSCSVPIVTPGLFEALKAGKIKNIQGTFERYDGKTIIMTGGERVEADTSILAVGWKLGVPYLPDEYQQKLVEPDGQYRVYRIAVNPDLPDMGFVGFNSSFCTVLSAEMIANWLVRYMDGQLERQPSEAEMTDNIEMMLNWKRKERPAAQIYGGLCSAPFHFKHFDELLADMGASKRKRGNPLAEQFSYPSHKAYGEFLASCPQYQAGA